MDTLAKLEKRVAELEIENRNLSQNELIDYKSLFLKSYLPAIIINPETGIIFDINYSAELLYGYEKDFLKGKPIFILINDTEDIVKQRLENTENGYINTFQSIHRSKTGKLINVEIFTGMVSSSEKRFIYFNVLDVTESKQQAGKIEQLSLGIKHSPIAICATDTKGVVTFVNQAYSLSTGYSAAEIIGKIHPLFLRENLNRKQNRELWKKLLSGNTWQGETQEILKNGESKIFRTNCAPIKNEGLLTGFFVFQENISEQKKIEQELVESRKKYQFIINSSPDTLFMSDKSGRILFVSESPDAKFAAIFKNIIGKKIYDIVSQEVGQNYKAKLKEVYKNKSARFETIIENSQGIQMYVEYNAFITVKDGKEYAVGSIRDITERKNYEERFTELFRETNKTKDLLRSVIQSSEDIIYAKEINGKYLLGGKAFTTHLNCSSDSVRGKTNEELGITDIVNHVDLLHFTEFQKDDTDVLRNRVTKNYTNIELHFPDGFSGIFDIKKIPLKDESGEAFAVLTIAHNISARAKAENDLKLLNETLEQKVEEKIRELNLIEENFKNLFEQNRDTLFITNRNGTILNLNAAALNSLGYTRSELLGRNVSLITSKQFQGQRSQFIKDLSEKKYSVFESENISKSGQIFPVEVGSTILIFNGNEVIFYTVRDISERKEMQKRILRTIIETGEKERLRFARDLHDGLGADLSSIKMYIDAIVEGHVPQEKIQPMLMQAKELIKEAANSAREIAYDMKPHVLENFGLKEVISNEITKLNRNMEVFINYNFDMFNIRLHKDIELNFYRIFKELINNSMKYSHADQITVVLFAQNTYLFFSFEDNGTGFDIENTLRSKSGNGLLNIRSRVDLMGGNCLYKSEIGEGFRVEIRLNIAQYIDLI